MTSDALDDFLSRTADLTGVHVEPLPLGDGFEALAARFAGLAGTVVLLSGGDLDCSPLSSYGRSAMADPQRDKPVRQPLQWMGPIYRLRPALFKFCVPS